MVRHHKILSFCAGLIFLILLQKFATPEPVFRFLVPAFIAYVVLLTLYNRWYLKKIERYNFWLLIRPILLFAAGFGLFLILPSEALRGLFLMVTVAVISVFEILLGNQAENILLVESLFISFGLFFAFFGWYHYAPPFQTLYLFGVFLGTFLLTRSTYEFIPKSDRTKAVGSLSIALFCAQLFWCLNFLPFHFSLLGLFLFNFYYFCLIVNYYHLFHILNFKKVQLHLALMAASVILVLFSTPWGIVQ